MRSPLAILLICIAALPCRADELSIRWPMKSSPAPTSNAVDTLKVDSWLVVESTGELFVRRYPEGKIAVVEATTRGGDRLYLLRGVSPGIVCVELVPAGVTIETAIVRHVVTVGDGTQPNPPPKPDPDSDPEPKPTAKTVSIAIVDDSVNRPQEICSVLEKLATWNAFQDAGHEFRLYDFATPEPRGLNAIKELGTGNQGIVIRDRKTLRVIHKGPIPATFTDLQALVGRLTGG